MTGRSRLLSCYPRAWRETYGEDLAAFLEDAYPHRLSWRAVASLVAAGLGERLRGSGLSAADRVRGGTSVVLAGWAAFVVAGASFAKLSEHVDDTLPDHSRRLVGLAYDAVATVATLTGLVVLAGVAVSVPAFVRLLTSGGWATIRRLVLRAACASGLTVVTTVGIIGWAHRLTQAQRNGTSAAYSATFLVWVALGVVALGLWTVAGVATLRELELSRRVLLIEAGLAAVATLGMLVMGIAIGVWTAEVTRHSHLGPLGPLNAQLVGTLALTVAAWALATVGVVRIARATPTLLALPH